MKEYILNYDSKPIALPLAVKTIEEGDKICEELLSINIDCYIVKKQMKVYLIDWETDNEIVDLPNEVIVPNEILDEDIANYISDKYGWLIKSLTLKKIIK